MNRIVRAPASRSRAIQPRVVLGPHGAIVRIAQAAGHGHVSGDGRRAPLRHTHENLNAVLWMQQSMEYQIASEGLYAHALHMLRAGIEKSRSDPSWSAAVEQRGGDYSALPPAVVMDLDETVLDNSPAQARGVVADEAEFDVKAWGEWVEKRSARRRARRHPFRAAGAEGRERSSSSRTARRRKSRPRSRTSRRWDCRTDPSDVLTLGETAPDGTRWVSDKTARRALLASTHRILLLVGDDLGDFISVAGRNLDARRAAAREFSAYWADRWVALPNPAYGSWERATFDRTRPDAGRLDQEAEGVEGVLTGCGDYGAEPRSYGCGTTRPRASRRNSRSVSFSVRAIAASYAARASSGRPSRAEQVGADGVEQVVAVERQAVDERERRRRPLDLGDRDRAVERDDRRRREREQLVVELHDLRASRSSAAVGASLCTALIAACSWYGPGLVAPQAPPHERLSLGDELAVPAAAVLVGEPHQIALRASCARGAARLDEQHQREQPSDLRLVGHQLDAAGGRGGSPRRRGRSRTRRSPRAGRVALVEDQVDDGEHRRAAASGSSASAGTRYGIRASRILPFARTSRCAMVGSGTRNARAISAVVRPPSSRSVSATCARRRERRVAAGEDQAQPVVAHGALLGRLVARRAAAPPARARSSRDASRRRRSIARLRAVVMIQPAGLGGQPGRRPALDRRGERVLHRLLGERRCRRRRGPGRPRRARTPRGRRARSPRVASAGASGHPAAVLERPHLDRAGRRASTAGEAGRACGAQASAASRSGASMTVEAADVLLALGERAVGHEHLAVAAPHDGGGARRVQPAGEDPRARRPSSRRWSAPTSRMTGSRTSGGGRRAVGLVDAEQVLGHGFSSSTPYTNGVPPDRPLSPPGDRPREGTDPGEGLTPA